MFLKLTQGTLCLMEKYRVSIMKGAAVPAFAYLSVYVVKYGLLELDPIFGSGSGWLLVPFTLVELAILTVLSVNVMRVVMLGEQPGVLSLRFSKREIKYLLYCVGLVVAWMIPALLASLSVSLVFFSFWLLAIPVLVLLSALVITLRLSLVFVGVAIDKDVSLRDSYSMTCKNQWALYFAFLLFSCLFLAIYYLVGFVGGLLDAYAFYLASFFFIHPLLDILMYVVGAIALSIFYAESHQKVGPPACEAYESP